MNTRLEQLLSFLEKEPHDPFTLYAIALEYMNIKSIQACIYFENLLSEHENYIPTYYHAAHFYTIINQPEKANAIYIKGIAIATKLNDHHALRELKNAYTLFLENED